jgi:hypothetical protein
MKTLAKIAFGALVLIAALLVFAARKWKELSALCGNEVLNTTLAPGGRTRAVLFRRDCGATTGFSTQVSLLRSSDSLPNEPGNVFVIGEDRGRAAPPPGSSPRVRVRWVDARRLHIRYDAGWRVFVADTLVDGIRVRYEKTTPGG